ncbi:NAD(P)-dependent oxidoreductase [Bordetella holmesii]|uniref:NAD(P)-dependent oxidoreductase n=1 Tax=Bordetella holmesii TaxID=35814 RepID=UPI000C766E68|nr:NAD(P)-dependent oxidoreductase [Bordetella holmesii]AUL20028.1 D-3-phosphoglycerate dehydrogenase [Bordetella holmesii]
MKKIYVLDAFHPSGPQWLNGRAEVIPFNDPRRAHWREDADGVMVRMTPLTEADFAKARRLKAVVKQGVGVNTIDLDAARRHGIVVANTPGVNSEAVAELALALALAVARRVGQFDRMIRAGEEIERPKLLGLGLQGKTVGVIGMGNIGVRAAAKFQAAFGCQVLAYDPFYKPRAQNDPWAFIDHERIDRLEALWPRLDLLTVHVPLTDATRHMVGARELAAMREGAIVVNVSRGGIVHEADLYDAIRSGHIFGAGLDVWQEREPPVSEHPLLSLPTVVATPHAGGGTAETQERSSLQVAQELFKVLEGGQPESRVA